MPQIINLTNLSLNQCQVSLLSRGLSFTPTPRPNIEELKTDISDFERRIRLKEFFDEGNPQMRNNSQWCPPPGRDTMLDSFCLFLQKLPLQAKPKYKYNVSALERQAII